MRRSCLRDEPSPIARRKLSRSAHARQDDASVAAPLGVGDPDELRASSPRKRSLPIPLAHFEHDGSGVERLVFSLLRRVSGSRQELRPCRGTQGLPRN